MSVPLKLDAASRLKKSQYGTPQNKTKSRLDKVIQIAALSTDINPTEQQKQTGNYRKGKFQMRGLTFVLENPRGSIRSGTGADGTQWSVVIPNHYGYISRTKSDADGDHLDVYIGPNPESNRVYAVDQVRFGGTEFDEHKFMVGFNSKSDAVDAYNASFSDNAPFGGMVELSWDEFKEWIDFGDSSAPIVDQMLRDFNSRVQLMKTSEDADGSVYLYGACMVPDVVDQSPFRDVYDEDEVRRVARAYLVKSRAAGYKHKAIFDTDDVQLTQSFIAPCDMQIGENKIPVNSWVVEFKLIHPEAIRMAKSGELAAFSIGGPSRKWRLERDNGEHSRWFGPNGDTK